MGDGVRPGVVLTPGTDDSSEAQGVPEGDPPWGFRDAYMKVYERVMKYFIAQYQLDIGHYEAIRLIPLT